MMKMFNAFGATMSSKSDCLVSIVVPVLNEEKYIKEFINSIVAQDFDLNILELLLVDGMSEDDTRNIIKSFCDKFSFIHMLDNPKRDIPFALNIGIRNAVGKYIVRMDAHTYYYPDYIRKCVEYIKKTGCRNVGGPTIAGWKTRKQRVIAAINESVFALGGGKNHSNNYEGFSDTVQFGTFEKDYLIKLGKYDENIKFAEDDDLNFRISENGGKIFISPEIKFVYYPRDNFKSLFVQYFRYGMWKVAVIKKHSKPARISHLVPLGFVIFLILTPFCFFNNVTMCLSAFIILIYLFLTILFSFKSKIAKKFSDKILLCWAHFVVHFSYGIGSLLGIFKFMGKKFENEGLEKKIFSDSELKNLQKRNLELILKFKTFCDNNNLRFCLCGGGCIGAVRHSGFIPWDDDLDVFMPREDYERLSTIDCSQEDFDVVRTNKKVFSGQTFTVVSDENSTLIKKEQIGLNSPRGVSLDVFPLDGCPDSKFKQKIQMLCARLFSLYTAQVVPKNHGLFIGIIGRILLTVIPKKFRFDIASFFEKNMSKYKIEDCKYIKELCAGPKYMQNVYDKKIFESFVLKDFEGHKLPIPAGYGEYLRTAFGNYMEFPPEEERVNSHDIVFLDLENSHDKYKNEF